MSPLVVLGTLATLISTINIVPHVVHAVRTKQPGGSPVAWAMGAASGVNWLVYGMVDHDFMIGAPGLITIPCGVFLAAASTRAARRSRRRTGVPPSITIVPEPRPEADVLQLEVAHETRAAHIGDTLELPRVPAIA